MARKTVAELKEYFRAGKRPTENQFEDFIDSFASLEDPQLFPKNYYKKRLEVNFPHQVTDQAVDILFGNRGISGWLEVEIVGTFAHVNSVGNIKKLFQLGANPDNYLWNPAVSRIVEAGGPIIYNIYIGDFVWDSSSSQYKITVFHTSPSGNMYDIRITYHCALDTSDLTDVKVSDIYTKPLTGQKTHYIHYNDNLGIGTSLPEKKLHVKAPPKQGNSNVVAALFERSDTSGGSNIIQLRYQSTADMELNSNYTGGIFRYGSYGDFNIVNNGPGSGINFVANAAVRLSVKPDGNIGIGTQNPKAKMNIVTGYTTPDSTGAMILGDTDQANLRFGCSSNYTWIQSHAGMPLHINPIGNNLILNTDAGNVGIGTRNPDQKLTVKGKIHAEDIIIDMNVPADYVFQKYFDGSSSIRPDYSMPDIREVEQFVKENKHLPEIPSGEDIQKKGVNIGDFQMKLLQKIEELTLYLIIQNKEIETLKDAVKSQQN